MNDIKVSHFEHQQYITDDDLVTIRESENMMPWLRNVAVELLTYRKMSDMMNGLRKKIPEVLAGKDS